MFVIVTQQQEQETQSQDSSASSGRLYENASLSATIACISLGESCFVTMELGFTRGLLTNVFEYRAEYLHIRSSFCSFLQFRDCIYIYKGRQSEARRKASPNSLTRHRLINTIAGLSNRSYGHWQMSLTYEPSASAWPLALPLLARDSTLAWWNDRA